MQQQEGSAKREEVLETNLLPASVPRTEVDLPPVVITEQPGLIRNNSVADGITGGN